ncbi:hypothetical protein Ancab_031855, partial [Ancistrocladus abbreviatus]
MTSERKKNHPNDSAIPASTYIDSLPHTFRILLPSTERAGPSMGSTWLQLRQWAALLSLTEWPRSYLSLYEVWDQPEKRHVPLQVERLMIGHVRRWKQASGTQSVCRKRENGSKSNSALPNNLHEKEMKKNWRSETSPHRQINHAPVLTQKIRAIRNSQ